MAAIDYDALLSEFRALVQEKNQLLVRKQVLELQRKQLLTELSVVNAAKVERMSIGTYNVWRQRREQLGSDTEHVDSDIKNVDQALAGVKQKLEAARHKLDASLKVMTREEFFAAGHVAKLHQFTMSLLQLYAGESVEEDSAPTTAGKE